MNYTVLVADDDEEDFMLLNNHVKACHQQVTLTYVQNGEETIRKLREGIRPALVIIDAQMPIMNGYETIRAIRNSPDWQHIPLLVWTESLSDTDNLRYYHAGANSVVLKHSALEQIDVFCNYWLELVELPTLY